MKIDNRLRLTIPVETEQGTVEVQAEQMPRTVFGTHYMTLAKCFTSIYEGAGVNSGPRIAAHLLRDIAKKDGVWAGATGVEMSIFNELGRTTMVKLADGGTLTLYEAVKKGLFDDDDQDWVENALVFFTVVCLMHTKGMRQAILGVMGSLWDAQISSSNPTVQTVSSTTSTATASSGATIQETESAHPS